MNLRDHPMVWANHAHELMKPARYRRMHLMVCQQTPWFYGRIL